MGVFCAVRSTKGIPRVALEDLTAWQKAKPSISGITTSEMMRSGARADTAASPSRPLPASWTS